MVARRPTRVRSSEADIAALRRAETLEDIVAAFGTKKLAWNAYCEHEQRVRGNPLTRPPAFWILALAPDDLRPRPRRTGSVPVRDEAHAWELFDADLRADDALSRARRAWLTSHGDERDLVPRKVPSRS